MMTSVEIILRDKDIKKGLEFLKYRVTTIQARLVLEMIIKELAKKEREYDK